MIAILCCIGWVDTADARVTRFIVESRVPFAEGTSFGSAGPYERLTGFAYHEVDPRDPLNSVITDIDKAPRNARGMVEFRTPFFILKPVDMARGNHKIFYTVNNRGNDPLLNAKTRSDVGLNDFPLRMGYTIADAGWEGDLVPVPARLAAELPIATQPDGSPIVERMRYEYSDRNIPKDGTFTLPLEGSPAFKSYEAATTDTARASLTVRDNVRGQKTAIPANQWAFGRCPSGKATLTPSPSDICVFAGFQIDKLYELIYSAKNPIVMGLGHATTRDVASFLRYDARDGAGNPNPLASGGAPDIRRIYATGASQTGGYLRDFMYLGFNEDESHRKVFDGIIPTIVGTDRVFINVRFADPNVFSSQDVTPDFLQTSFPPFTYGVSYEPMTGIRDGILRRPATDPHVLQIDSATEFWQLRASLNTVDSEGHAVPAPSSVRLYFVSSTAHSFTTSGLTLPPPGRMDRCENPTTTPTSDIHRAMLVAMDEWVDEGIEPPPSNYPRVEDGTLVPAASVRGAFPAIPRVTVPPLANDLDLLDFGPAFGHRGGVMAVQPPQGRHVYRVLVPKPDADGLDLGGTRVMQVRVPLGTSTGWNTRTPGRRGPDLCGLIGSFIPFARTAAERQALGDPRRSLEERYRDRSGFFRAVEAAANALVAERFLLREDADRYIAAAKAADPFAPPASTTPR